MSPRFSVLIPAYNGAAVLGGAIRSVLAQTCADWELIVGDNASEEDLAAIVDEHPDPRVRYVRFDEHVGIFDSFNRTFGLAAGDWVYLLPTDDRLAPECLATIGRAIDQNPDGPNPLALVISRAKRIDPEGRPFEREYYGFEGAGDLPTGRHDAGSWMRAICSPGSPPWEGGAFRREIVEEMGVFFRPDEPSMSADLELTLRIAAFGDVVYLDEPLISVTGWVESHTTGRRARNRASREKGTPESLALASALRAHEARRVVTPEERAAVNGAMARSYLRRASAHRYRPGGRGRVAALRDVASAARLGGRQVLSRAVGLAPLVGVAPSRTVRGVRAAAISARASRAGDPAPDPNPTAEPAAAGGVGAPPAPVSTSQSSATVGATATSGAATVGATATSGATTTYGGAPSTAGSGRRRTAGWGLADQIVASGSNFALGLAAARALDPAPLGAFAIVFSCYLLALNVGRASIAQPFVARHGHLEVDQWHEAAGRATGTAVTIGAALGCVAALASLILGHDLGAGLLVLAACLPGLLLEDSLRYAFVAGGRPRLAFTIDALWAVLALVPLAWAALARPVPLAFLVLAWGASGVLAGVVGVMLARTRPRPRTTPDWIREHRDLLPALVGGTLLELSAQTLTTAGIAAIAGLEAAGALRVGQLLLSPAFVVYQATSLVVPPEAARVLLRAPGRLAGFVARACLVLVTIAIVVAVAIALVPESVGRDVLPTNWNAGHGLIAPLAIALAGQVTAFGSATVLLVTGAMGRTFRMSIATASLLAATQLTGAAIGGAANGAMGAAIGLSIAYPTLALLGWSQALAALRDRARRARGAGPAQGQAAQTSTAQATRGA